jgi:hypothetical protein
MQKGPELRISFQNDVRPPSAVSAIRASHGSKFIAKKMFTAGAAMTTAAKNVYLVYKVGFFHEANFRLISRRSSDHFFVSFQVL